MSSTHTLGSDCSAHALNLGHSSHTLDFYPSTHVPRSDPSAHTAVTNPSANTPSSGPSSALPRKKSKQMSKTPDSQSSTLGVEASSSSSYATTSRSHGANSIGSSEIDTNECCICFRNFNDYIVEKTGLDWVECVCGRWLHEDCISYDITNDANGRELLCPFCCV